MSAAREEAGPRPAFLRLASATPGDNRITLGCVVVPVSFYENVVEPLIGRRHAVVYVLPESGEISGLLAAH